jgi:hypothetical protein
VRKESSEAYECEENPDKSLGFAYDIYLYKSSVPGLER